MSCLAMCLERKRWCVKFARTGEKLAEMKVGAELAMVMRDNYCCA